MRSPILKEFEEELRKLMGALPSSRALEMSPSLRNMALTEGRVCRVRGAVRNEGDSTWPCGLCQFGGMWH